MGSGFSKMKKQARLMQEQYTQMQEEMRNKRITGTSGNGLVTVILDGNGKLHEIKIKPDCVDREDVEGLEDLIKAAFDQATSQLESETQGDSGPMMGNLPFSL